MNDAVALMAARQEHRMRQERNKIFGSGLLSDPVWDLLLDQFIAAAEGRIVLIKAACDAAAMPSATALRCITQLIDAGLLTRRRHPLDRRCQYLELTTDAYDKMRSYFTNGEAFAGTYASR